jgi:1-acyl-sn-glycerol-3-phosphate acyltransferase
MIRSLIYVAWLYGSMAVIGIAFAPVALFSGDAALLAARIWSRIAVWGVGAIVGLRVEVRGREHIPAGAGLVAMKHQAMLDTLMPAWLLNRPSIVLKQELTAMPIFGWFAQRSGMIALDREGHAGALRRMLRDARDRAASGRPIVIYPEGTRQDVGAPPAYKPGVAALYRDLKLPCTPVAVNTGLYWPAHGVRRKPGLATIEFLPAIEPGLSREDFMAELERRIETATDALVAAARSSARDRKPAAAGPSALDARP